MASLLENYLPLLAYAQVFVSRAAQRRSDAACVRRDALALLDRADRASRDAPVELVRAARLAACAFIDEMLLTSQWKDRAAWARSTLQLSQCGTVNAGVEFYTTLEKLLRLAKKATEELTRADGTGKEQALSSATLPGCSKAGSPADEPRFPEPSELQDMDPSRLERLLSGGTAPVPETPRPSPATDQTKAAGLTQAPRAQGPGASGDSESLLPELPAPKDGTEHHGRHPAQAAPADGAPSDRKTFGSTEEASPAPRPLQDVLRLYATCLSMGFHGRFGKSCEEKTRHNLAASSLEQYFGRLPASDLLLTPEAYRMPESDRKPSGRSASLFLLMLGPALFLALIYAAYSRILSSLLALWFPL